jgi:hypothetical protein
VNLELNPGEAILTLGAIGDKSAEAATTWRRLEETNAPAEERAAALVAFQVLSRVEARLSNILYPPCAWWQGECDRSPVAGSAYCQIHGDLVEGKRVVFSA